MNRALWLLPMHLLLALLSGCAGTQLVDFGYTSTNKVWYHFYDAPNSHHVVVCDLQPNGNETNCRESEM